MPLPLRGHAKVVETEIKTPKSSEEVPVVVNPESLAFPHRLAKKKKVLDDQEVLKC